MIVCCNGLQFGGSFRLHPQHRSFQPTCTGFMLGLLSDLEDRSDTFPRNIRLSPNFTALQPRRPQCIVLLCATLFSGLNIYLTRVSFRILICVVCNLSCWKLSYRRFLPAIPRKKITAHLGTTVEISLTQTIQLFIPATDYGGP
jgi:hypothetical protein